MVKQIIKEAMEKNPIGLKEAVEAELMERITVMLRDTKPENLNEETIQNFAEKLVKKLNKDIGLTYDHPRWGQIPANTYEAHRQSGKGSRNQKSRGFLIKWTGKDAAYQTGKNRSEIRKAARKLIDNFLASGKKIDVTSKVFGDPEGAYRFGNIIVLDEKEYLLVFTASKLRNSRNYQKK